MKRVYRKIVSMPIIFLLVLTSFALLLTYPIEPVKGQTSYDWYMGITGGLYVVSHLSDLSVHEVQSTSSSYVFNWLMGSSGQAVYGDTLYVQNGAYSADGTWILAVADNIQIVLGTSAVVTLESHLNVPVFIFNGVNYCDVTGGVFDGNAYNQDATPGSEANGVMISYGSHNIFHYSTIQNVRIFGFYTVGASAYDTIDHCNINHIGWNPINLGSGDPDQSNCYATNNVISYFSDVGITSYCPDNIIASNTFSNIQIFIGGWEGAGYGSLWAIGFETNSDGTGGNYATAYNNVINGSPSAVAGIVINAGSNVMATGNTISNCIIGLDDSGNAHNVFQYNTVSYCNTGLLIQSYSYQDRVSYNSFSNCLVDIQDYGTDTIYDYPVVTPTPAPTGAPTPTPSTTPTASPTPTVTPTPSTSPGTPFLITQDPFAMSFNAGEAFAVQSVNPDSTITFTITAGTLNATGSVNATSTGGIFEIVPSTSGTLLITTSGQAASVYIDGIYKNNIPYDFYSGDPTITWTYGTSPIIISGNGIQYYFRSDTYTTFGVAGYGLDDDYTNTAQSINKTYTGSGTVNYAIRAYLFSAPTRYIELTSGPSATIPITGNYSGTATANVNIPETSVTLGYQALQIDVIEQFNGGSYITVASYVSPVLITDRIESSTWTLSLNITQTDNGASTVSSFSFGDATHKSGVNNIVFSKPLQSDIAMWRLSRGDYIGWLLGEYLDEIGIGFYGLCLFLVGSTLYFRYKHFGTILFFFSVYGGVGGVAWVFLPPWGAAVAAAIIIIGGGFLVYRIVR
jgi:hypothetical protein